MNLQLVARLAGCEGALNPNISRPVTRTSRFPFGLSLLSFFQLESINAFSSFLVKFGC